jgi:hypothetical protein
MHAGNRHLGHRRHRGRHGPQGKLEFFKGVTSLMHIELMKARGTNAVHHVEQGLGLRVEGHDGYPDDQ